MTFPSSETLVSAQEAARAAVTPGLKRRCVNDRASLFKRYQRELLPLRKQGHFLRVGAVSNRENRNSQV